MTRKHGLKGRQKAGAAAGSVAPETSNTIARTRRRRSAREGSGSTAGTAVENSLSESRPRRQRGGAAPTQPQEQEQELKQKPHPHPHPHPPLARQPSKHRTQSKPSAAADAIPEAVRHRFLQVGRAFYFPDGARAFTDRGKRLTTPSENTEVVKSMISIAQARGWSQIQLRGTERFRRDAWEAARLVGLEVRGYRPNEFEQERLIRTLARQSLSTGDRVAEDQNRARDAGAIAAPPAPAAPRQEGVIAGRLIDHGPAPYKHESGAARSYFVRLETQNGERTVWGIDLERALRESLSQPKTGEEVGLRRTRREAVTVKAPERDSRGTVIGQRDKAAHRNAWVVEKTEFLVGRAAAARTFADAEVSAKAALREHPELLGSYLQLRSAEEVAALRIRDPQDQRQFVDLVRRALANSIASGAPLPPVRVRERAEARAPRGQDRVVAPTRA